MTHPAIATWEALPWEDRMALLGALEEEASQHHRDATEACGSRADNIPPALRERHAALAATWEAAHAVLQRPDTVTSKDKAQADYEAEKAAAVPMLAPTPRAMADAACARRVLGQGHQEGFEEGVRAERARVAATLAPSDVTLAKVLAAYEARDWLALADALYAACLIGNGKDEGGLNHIGQALLGRARKEGAL